MKIVIIVIALVIVYTGQSVGGPTIIWSGDQNIVMGPLGPGSSSGLGSWNLDVNNDSTYEYGFTFPLETFLVSPMQGNMTVVMPREGDPGIFESAVLSAGTPIDSSLGSTMNWSGVEQTLVHWFGLFGGENIAVGPWAGVSHGYLGISFEMDEQMHYGWIQMSVSDESPYGIIHSWAYESQPGVGIIAGVVPEPSTIGLFVIGIGCLGAGAVRRRRKRLTEANRKHCQPEGAGDSQ